VPIFSTQQSFQPTLKAAQFWALIGCVGLGAAEAVVGPFVAHALPVAMSATPESMI
jgi:hypothetical protein